MEPAFYISALFIFLLVCIAIWLVARVVRSKKKAVPANEKDNLFKLYQGMEDMMNSLEEYVEKAKEDMAKDREEAARMLEKVESLYKEMKEKMQAIPEATEKVREPVLTAVPRARETAVKVLPPVREQRPAPAPIPVPVPARPVISTTAGIPDAYAPEGALKKNKIVRFMRDEGLSDEQIAKELGISRGEVALILGIKEN